MIDIYLMLISCRRKDIYILYIKIHKNNINDDSNKIIILWQIIIQLTFFSFQNACMFLHVIETNVQLFFSLEKILIGVYAWFFLFEECIKYLKRDSYNTEFVQLPLYFHLQMQK